MLRMTPEQIEQIGLGGPFIWFSSGRQERSEIAYRVFGMTKDLAADIRRMTGGPGQWNFFVISRHSIWFESQGYVSKESALGGLKRWLTRRRKVGKKSI
jgi:hypothetical protein